jgi:2-dehydro-3-deoxyphosphogluconate aldolase/(4S)-4-hydroxy-2-oxoglutarate aldolase
MSSQFSFDLFNQLPIVGIMRNFPHNQVQKVAELYHQSGLTCLEITMNSPGAAEIINSLTKQYSGKLNIGAGTVCSIHDLENALTANAQFIVTPVINEEVIKACVEQQIPIFPGAYTPTEIYKAWDLGATMVKIFPATTPQYIKEILGPLNQIKLIPTGGVGLDNLAEYLNAGAKGAGIGSHLFPKKIIEEGDWDTLTQIFLSFSIKFSRHEI